MLYRSCVVCGHLLSAYALLPFLLIALITTSCCCYHKFHVFRLCPQHGIFTPQPHISCVSLGNKFAYFVRMVCSDLTRVQFRPYLVPSFCHNEGGPFIRHTFPHLHHHCTNFNSAGCFITVPTTKN